MHEQGRCWQDVPARPGKLEGPELQRMPKVEFLSIFTILALFRLAHILISPAKSFDIFVILVSNSVDLSKYITCKSKALTINAYYSYLQLIVGLEAFIIDAIHWICRDGVVGIFCVIAFLVTWHCTIFWLINHSFQWWLILIAGIWNNPYECSLKMVFVDPSWSHEYQQPSIHVARQYRRFLRDQLFDERLKYESAYRQLHQLCRSPIITILRWNILGCICCIINITELFLQLGWYTSWIVVFKLGLLHYLSPSTSCCQKRHHFHKTKNKRRRRRLYCHHRARLADYRFHAFSTVLNIDDKMSERNPLHFGSNSSSFVCDNSANVHICNDKSIFVGDISRVNSGAVATIGGKANRLSGIGTVKWEWKDDHGHVHSYLIKNVLYFPSSPINILSVTELANQLDDNSGTGITTIWHHSTFFWDNQKFQLTIIHPTSNLPEMPINEGFSLHSLWTWIVGRRVNTSKLHCHCSALASISDVELSNSTFELSSDTATNIAQSLFHVGETLVYSSNGWTSYVKWKRSFSMTTTNLPSRSYQRRVTSSMHLRNNCRVCIFLTLRTFQPLFQNTRNQHTKSMMINWNQLPIQFNSHLPKRNGWRCMSNFGIYHNQ